jgi:hypothetical protein
MATIGGSNIVTSGLVLSLDAANSTSYPGSGTTWFDVSGNNNHLTFSGTPNIAHGEFNTGGTVYAYRNFIPVNSATNGYTMEVFFKINSSLSVTWQNIIQNGVGDPNRNMVWYNGGTNTFEALFHTPSSYNKISDSVLLNFWYYLQIAYNPSGGGSNGRRAWINGVEKTVTNTGIGNANVTAGNFTVSSDSSLGSNKSDVTYSTVRYYNRVLSELEIQQNYNSQKSRFGL